MVLLATIFSSFAFLANAQNIFTPTGVPATSIGLNTSFILNSVGIGTNFPLGTLGLKGNLAINDKNATTPWGFLDINYKDALNEFGQTTPDQGSGTAYFTLSRWGGMFAWGRQGPNGYVKMMRLDNVYGASTGGSTFRIDGEIKATQVRVIQNVWADYVFADDFKLRPLAEVATFIGKNKHLPDVPSQAEITTNGLDLGEMQKIHMQKIEELTLYLLQQEKRIQELERKLSQISKKK